MQVAISSPNYNVLSKGARFCHSPSGCGRRSPARRQPIVRHVRCGSWSAFATRARFFCLRGPNRALPLAVDCCKVVRCGSPCGGCNCPVDYSSGYCDDGWVYDTLTCIYDPPPPPRPPPTPPPTLTGASTVLLLWAPCHRSLQSVHLPSAPLFLRP